jgi:hypothetical protein
VTVSIAVSGSVSDGIVAAMRDRAVATEAIVKAHLETHPLLEWVAEVQRLNGIRANVARELGPESPIGAMISTAASRESLAAVSWRACLRWLRDDGPVTPRPAAATT